MVKVTIRPFTVPLSPGIVGFRVGLLGVAGEGTVIECFKERFGG